MSENMCFKKIVLVGFLLINVGIAIGQSHDKKVMHEKMDALDEYLQYAVVNNEFSGQVLVADDQHIWLDKGYGYADRREEIEIDEKTVFYIGEAAGQFTVTAILKLEEEGKLSVIDNLSKFFSEVPSDKGDITIHHLITHTSGLPESLGGEYEIITRNKMIKNAMETKLLYKPGEKYSYSRIGYNLLAAIIEIVTGEYYEDYLHDKLFKKAHMHQTGYTIPKYSDKDIAVGYTKGYKWGKPAEHVLGTTGPSWYSKGISGFMSNAKDLYSWYHAVHGEHIIGPDNVYRLYLPQTDMPDANSIYCYGWVATQSEWGGGVIKTEGNNDVFYTTYNLYLESGFVIILITNSYNETIPDIVARIEQHVFN